MIEIPKSEIVEISKLKTDGDNPNVMSERHLKALEYNIKKYGFLIPIITNKELLIADGEQRLEVARRMKMKSVSVIRLPVDEVNRKILRQVMNKLKGQHDKNKDEFEFKDIFDGEGWSEFEKLMGLTEKESSMLMDMFKETEEVEFIDPPKEPKTKKGDIYILGEHKLMCGDSTNSLNVGNLLGNQKADMVFTDPPYNVSYGKPKGQIGSKKYRNVKPIINDSMSAENWIKFCDKFTDIISEYVKGAYYVCHAPGPDGRIMAMTLDGKFHWSATIIWNKMSMIIGMADFQRQYEPIWYGWDNNSEIKHHKSNDRNITDVWDIPKPSSNDSHPTMKPIKLCEIAIKRSSVEGNIVLDLFGGSGSTLIACEQLKRRCFMMEIDPSYCDVIVNRWENLTGKSAIKQK